MAIWDPTDLDVKPDPQPVTRQNMYGSQLHDNGCESPLTPGERIAMAYNEALATLVDAVNVAKANLAEAEGMLERFRKDTADIGNPRCYIPPSKDVSTRTY